MVSRSFIDAYIGTLFPKVLKTILRTRKPLLSEELGTNTLIIIAGSFVDINTFVN
jgi:hypothetical protein